MEMVMGVFQLYYMMFGVVDGVFWGVVYGF